LRLLRSIEKIAMVSQSSLHRLTLVMLGMGLSVAASVGVAGCAGAPVQEMSNARQAIKAARDAAGSSAETPASLLEAEALLNRAEDSLQKRAYKQARRDAIAARGKAAEALNTSRTAAEDHNGAG
jgi:hypothetical protein